MMTPEELAQKHCWNGHDPAKCSFLADIRELFDTECAQFKAEIDSLRMLAKRVSPATEPCECPAFCSYHARSRFEEMRAELIEAVRKGKLLCQQNGEILMDNARLRKVLEALLERMSAAGEKMFHDYTTCDSDGCNANRGCVVCVAWKALRTTEGEDKE